MDSPVNPLPRGSPGLWFAALAPVFPQLLGSAFNIWYNIAVVDPLLATPALKERFFETILIYNLAMYPAAIALWLRLVLSLRSSLLALQQGIDLPADRLARDQRRLIQLPWWGASICAVAWLLCVPVFLISLRTVGQPLDPGLIWHLPISFVVSAFIAITHSFFLIELASHRCLFPAFFRTTRADRVPGAFALSLRGRGVLWAVSAGICPIGSLLLLGFAPPSPGSDPQWFAVFVGTVGIAFGLCTALLISHLVAEPIDHLRGAAREVAAGNVEVRVALSRADEIGELIAEFNYMIGELKEKERLRQTFGLHVGRQAAEQILARDPGLGGVEQTITVMFVDIRSFTARAGGSSATEIVHVLNQFLGVMVQVVEEHRGLINKFLGDGFMALFGIGEEEDGHADDALHASRAMLNALADLNRRLSSEDREALSIGIGLHTGPAIVGSIGSPARLEFTAIGSTVNVASRIEALTKSIGTPVLLSASTHAALRFPAQLTAFEPQTVRGVEEAVTVYTLEECRPGV